MQQKSLWDAERENAEDQIWRQLTEESRAEIVGLFLRLLAQSAIEGASTQTRKEHEP